MPRAGIALGSNLGDRSANLLAALACLLEISHPGDAVLTAPVYQNEPCHCPPGSPDFLNTVVEISFSGSPLDLLANTRAMERQLGRVHDAPRNAPRTIDLDLLYLGDIRLMHGPLILPHPRLLLRRFVLQPLADIRPDLVLPGEILTVAECLARLSPDEPPLLRV